MSTFDGWLISRLVAHGVYNGKIDDVPGRQMHQALVRFQTRVGIRATGLADQLTVDALRLSPASGQPALPALKLPAEPVWMREARRFMDLKEIPGSKSNPVIIGWAQRFGGWIASFYTNDDTPWCGLFMGHVIAVTLPDEALPANPLSALAWQKLGDRLTGPAVGAILIFRREGGGHVGLYVGEDDTDYHVLGGNQSNSVSITRIEKGRLVAVRWPRTGGDPVGTRVKLKANGRVSRNEA